MTPLHIISNKFHLNRNTQTYCQDGFVWAVNRWTPGVVNQLSVMGAIIPFKLTDDRRTTITPGYIAIVGRCLGKWISMLVAISLPYLWKWSILMWKTFWVHFTKHFHFEENSHDHNYPAFQSYMITESVRDDCETEIDGWPLWPCDPSGQCNDGCFCFSKTLQLASTLRGWVCF